MVNIFIFYFPPQLAGGFWSSTLKEICLFSKTPPTQLLDTPPCCLDTERATARDLMGQNMIVEGYDQIIAVHSLQLCKHGGVSSKCVKCDFAK